MNGNRREVGKMCVNSDLNWARKASLECKQRNVG